MFLGFSDRVTENESVNKMSLHNLATVFGPTLLRPSEKDSKILNSSQPISMNDSWSLEVMAQVNKHHPSWKPRHVPRASNHSVSVGASASLLPPAGEYPSARQQTSKPSLLHRSMTAKVLQSNLPRCSQQRTVCCCFTLKILKLANRWSLHAALEGPKHLFGANVFRFLTNTHAVRCVFNIAFLI